MHNLLIIDDEEIIINLLHDYFSQLGYSVVTAKDGNEGIDLFNASPNFDLVITDINMPGIDGNAVAKGAKGAIVVVVPSRMRERIRKLRHFDAVYSLKR